MGFGVDEMGRGVGGGAGLKYSMKLPPGLDLAWEF